MTFSKNLIDKLAKIVYEYAKENRLPDEQFVYYCYWSLLQELNVESFIDSISFSEDYYDDDSICSYSFLNKKITISLQNIINDDFQKFNDYEFELNKYDKFILILLDIINSLTHEMSHANQYKIALSSENSFEKKLTIVGLERNLKIQLNKKLTHEELLYFYLQYEYASEEDKNFFYFYNPCERMAYINGYNIEMKIGEQLAKSEIQSLAKENLMCVKLKEYNNPRIGPTIEYLRKVNLLFNVTAATPGKKRCTDLNLLVKRFNEIARQEKYDDDQKLYFGLPISFETYQEDLKLLKIKQQ